MKILVTGGLGFIGSNFIHYWLKNHPGDSIVNLDKVTYAADFKNLEGIDTSKKYSFVKGDIADQNIVNKVSRDVDLIVNFAAETHVDNSILNQAPFLKSNVMGTYALLEAARKYDIRFHHISTDEIFGPLEKGSRDKFNETSRYNPKNPYSATKAAADHLVNSYHNTYGIKSTISNCGNNYGPRQHPEKLIPKSITNAIRNKSIPIYGDGQQIRDWIYVDDHCSAVDAVIRKGKIGESYVVSSGNEMQNIQVVTAILSRLKKSKKHLIKYVKDRPGHDVRYATDASKIRQELGWKPRFSFEKGIQYTIDYYKNKLNV
jgi:dTDP-glucose 4,6-dehydratase